MPLKTEQEIRRMRTAGLLVWSAHRLVSEIIRPGMTTKELDAEVDKLFAANRAVPCFKGVHGRRFPYPAATCVSINEQVVHAIPSDRVIQEGDIVSVDTGCKIDGWCGDAADTYLVGTVDEESKKLVDTTRAALMLAIEKLKTAKLWSDVAGQMERRVKKDGFSVVEVFVGHGIGRQMHEEPQVPNYVYSSFLRYGDFKIRPGVVIAIEPMVNAGTKRVAEGRDGWEIVTADKKRSAHIEHSVGILSTGPYVLTGPPQNDEEEAAVKRFFDRYQGK
ncbi:MAG: type I methionyl aminopeptidase [Thermoguttaceae bacterium]|nr:type I methionyl aminopeptidase [Thermoguttaceae bacterium]